MEEKIRKGKGNKICDDQAGFTARMSCVDYINIIQQLFEKRMSKKDKAIQPEKKATLFPGKNCGKRCIKWAYQIT